MVKNISISEYVEAVENVMQYWLDRHTNPQKWAEEWTMDGDVLYTFNESPVLSNNYFYFDWKEAAIRYTAEEQLDLFCRCSACGSINERGRENCCDENEESEDVSLDELIDWLSELEPQPSESALIKALEIDGFNAYQDGIEDVIRPVVEEVNNVLKSLREAETNADRLGVIAWANHVCHVNGNIVRDYSNYVTNIDYNLIDSISQGGLESVFSAEDIAEYIAEE